MPSHWDILIIGGGPAGLTAGLYAARARLKVKVFEKESVGGQAAMTDVIENYPGFPEGISGFELTRRISQQAEKFGLLIDTAPVQAVDFQKPDKILTVNGTDHRASTVIVATGRCPTKLNVPGEQAFVGRGVSYCATCDGPFFQNKQVFVVGGGDSAIEEAIYLTRFAKQVAIVHRRDQLRATKVLQEKALDNEKIKFLWNSIVTSIEGNHGVRSIVVRNIQTQKETTLPTDGVFVYIGSEPNTGFLKNQIETDELGFIVTDEKLETSIPGIFAAGDVRRNQLKQVATAVGEGALAAISAEKYLESSIKGR